MPRLTGGRSPRAKHAVLFSRHGFRRSQREARWLYETGDKQGYPSRPGSHTLPEKRSLEQNARLDPARLTKRPRDAGVCVDSLGLIQHHIFHTSLTLTLSKFSTQNTESAGL